MKQTMKNKYRIIDLNNGRVLDIVAANSSRQAIDIWCRDNGYRINLNAELVEGN